MAANTNPFARSAHLVARKDGVLCTGCFVTEPVHCGDGTPLPSLIMAYENLVRQHRRCAVLPKEGQRKFREAPR